MHWYQNGSGGALLFSGNSYTTPVINSSTDYWVASYNSITGCESFRRRVHIAIHPVPALPVTQPVQHCGNSSLVLPAVTGANGNTNRWYDAAMGGNLLAQSVTYTTPVLSGPVTYWVSSYNDTTGCESNRVPLAVQIDPVPGLPVAADSSRCGEGFLTLNSSTGNGRNDQPLV